MTIPENDPEIPLRSAMIGNKTIINSLLAGLVILDGAYVIVAFFFPEWWFASLHGVAYVDPEGLLPRAGAVWLAFVFVQLLTLTKWQSRSYWLAITAGLRSAELFTEWTYLFFAHDMTIGGKIGLFLSTPANMVVCWFFFQSFLKQSNSPSQH
jgi:hypothetical protein